MGIRLVVPQCIGEDGTRGGLGTQGGNGDAMPFLDKFMDSRPAPKGLIIRMRYYDEILHSCTELGLNVGTAPAIEPTISGEFAMAALNISASCLINFSVSICSGSAM